jgi:hypothetical protein
MVIFHSYVKLPEGNWILTDIIVMVWSSIFHEKVVMWLPPAFRLRRNECDRSGGEHYLALGISSPNGRFPKRPARMFIHSKWDADPGQQR